jgi:hypothetical protein
VDKDIPKRTVAKARSKKFEAEAINILNKPKPAVPTQIKCFFEYGCRSPIQPTPVERITRRIIGIDPRSPRSVCVSGISVCRYIRRAGVK